MGMFLGDHKISSFLSIFMGGSMPDIPIFGCGG